MTACLRETTPFQVTRTPRQSCLPHGVRRPAKHAQNDAKVTSFFAFTDDFQCNSEPKVVLNRLMDPLTRAVTSVFMRPEAIYALSGLILVLAIVLGGLQIIRDRVKRRSLAIIAEIVATRERTLTMNDVTSITPHIAHQLAYQPAYARTHLWTRLVKGMRHGLGNASRVAFVDPSASIIAREANLFFYNPYRPVPSLFIITGLMLTFLGLVAALQETGLSLMAASGGGGATNASLSNLLVIASSKFIMSIAGLFSSIVLTIAFWINDLENRRAALELTAAIEMRTLDLSQSALLDELITQLAPTRLRN